MLRRGHVIALCVLALLTVGVIMVNSAVMTVRRADPVAAQVGPSPRPTPPVTAQSVLLSRPTIYMGMALVALGVGAFLPVRAIAARLAAPDPRLTAPGTPYFTGLGPVVIASLSMIAIMALVYTPLVGKEVNGAHRWLRLPVPGLGDALSMQPSEIAKWILVGLIAWYGARRAAIMPTFWRGLVPALAAVGIVAGFVVLEDLGTGMLITSAACIVLIAAGARVWHFAMFIPAAVLGLTVAIIKAPYRLARITAFIDPYLDPKKSGYHMIQSMAAVAGGEGAGRGLGHGQQKFGYLPEDQNDFLFAIICEELGIAGAAVVIGLFVLLVWTGVGIIRREREPFLKLLGLGILCTVALQAVINLVVVTGLGPTKGIALPLVSAGGTGWILTAFSLGLLVAIDRTQPEEAAEPSLNLSDMLPDAKAPRSVPPVVISPEVPPSLERAAVAVA